MLEPWRLQLQSPIGYDEEFADDFSSVTASCGAAGYSYSTPPVYGTPVSPSSTSTSSSAVPSSCATPYTVSEGDTCESIAAARNVSSYGIIEANELSMYCHLPAAGQEICLPAQCRTHFLLIDDNCATLSRQYGVSRVQLVSWNGNFDVQCLFVERWRYTTVCVRYVHEVKPLSNEQAGY
jgi:LysM repeat protein